ncbi:MBL fold metallo-hydrolase [Zafaria cholistanensis]|uniref:MBL fold metallo-hydrolase n=1 Tax=Zafaria cholistanensis TaxID=1682741 RepID=A0A5A7NU67_9MICC|nr:MBL fold metallo-hydrolase [Zafaria cholistanensis]
MAVSAFASVLTAPNPGPMTLDGTNSYVLRFPGWESCVVVDPGPDHEGHLRALAAEGPVELVLVTHWHRDHTGGIDRLVELTGAPVRAALPEYCRGADPLFDGEVVHAAGLEARVVAAPGHTADSLCFFLPEDGPRGAVLTGDTVLGRGTTSLGYPDGTLADFFATLDRLEEFGAAPGLSAHGPLVPDLSATVRSYRAHRLERLDQVRAALATLGGTGTGEPPVSAVADLVYAGIEASKRPAVEHGVAAQLHYLLGSGELPGPGGKPTG